MRAVPIAPKDFKGRYSTRERLALLIGDRRGTVAWLAVCSIFSGLSEAFFLAVVSQIGLALVNGAKKVTDHNGHLGFIHLHTSVHTLLLVALGLAVARLIVQIPLSVLPSRIAADVQGRLRKDLFEAYTVASWGVQSREREGHLQETMTGQVMQATGGALQATGLITSLFTFLVLLGTALALNPPAAGIVLGATVLLFGALRPLNQLGVKRSRELSKAQLEYAGGVGQAGRLAEETHVFGVASAQRGQVNGLIDTARNLFFRTQTIGRITPNVYQSMVYLILVGGLWVLSTLGTKDVVSLGAIIILLLRAGSYGQSVQGSWQMLRQSLPFIERLQDTRERYLQSGSPEGILPLGTVQSLAFENVGFGYEADRPVLSDVTFEVFGGEAVGVIGPSGAGKSTLIQILLRLRVPSSGRFLVNGEPAEQYVAEDWHRRVAYVPQEPRLLHASVAENIRYFRDVDDEAVERAAKLARIHEDVMDWPQGYDTIVGPRADAVSGGQQQRICLARALVARPEVLVLDEPTSALDPHSESLIQESLTALADELTLFIVAHRMSTLDICNRVMVIIDGRLVAFDTIEELKNENAYYRSASALAAGTGGGLL
jgi:ATP-binding cassette subfamily B protein